MAKFSERKTSGFKRKGHDKAHNIGKCKERKGTHKGKRSGKKCKFKVKCYDYETWSFCSSIHCTKKIILNLC